MCGYQSNSSTNQISYAKSATSSHAGHQRAARQQSERKATSQSSDLAKGSDERNGDLKQRNTIPAPDTDGNRVREHSKELIPTEINDISTFTQVY